MIDWGTVSVELSKKLDQKHIKGRRQGGGQVQYIEGWHAIAEMNRIFGFGVWDRETIDLRQLGEPREVDGKLRVDYMARVRVTLHGEDRRIVRDGCGFGQGIDRDVGQAHESALKEAETDAMKRAMMTLGNLFGLALYDKSRANVAEPAPEPTAQDLNIRDRLVAALDKNGPAFAKDAAFAKTHAALRTNAPELAAQVDAHAKQLTELQEKDAA